MKLIEKINLRIQARRVFGFREDYTPTEQEVKKRFRQFAKQLHPDTNPENPDTHKIRQLILYRKMIEEPISLEEQYLIKFYNGWF